MLGSALHPDNQITVFVEKPEMGQGQRTIETMLLAEELEVDLSCNSDRTGPHDS